MSARYRVLRWVFASGAVLAGCTPLSSAYAAVVGRSPQPGFSGRIDIGDAVVRVMSLRGGPFGRQRVYGSGVIVRPDGWVVTCAHVVANGSALRVTLANGLSYRARVLDLDLVDDLALLKIEPRSDLHAVFVGSDHTAILGTRASVVGYPRGGEERVTQGRVSAVSDPAPGIASLPPTIQIDAEVQVGDSGGALLNDDGRLLGIVVGRYATAPNAGHIGFAVSERVVAEFLERGDDVAGNAEARSSDTLRELTGSHPLGGASVTDLTPSMAIRRRVDPSLVGVLIVHPGESQADISGFRAGDVVVSVNGTPTTSTLRLIQVLGSSNTWTITIRRAGKTLTAMFGGS